MGHTDNHLGLGEIAALMNLANEMFDHFFGHVEIGNHAVAHRPDCLDRSRGPAQHQLGILTHGKHFLFAILELIGHDRWLIQDDALALHIDKRVCRAQINGHIR